MLVLLKRKMYDRLLEWKEYRHKEHLQKCLLVKGARQVGKSFIVKEFGKNEYKSFVCIDFYRQPALKSIFDGDLTSEEILKRITANVRDFSLVPGDIRLPARRRLGAAVQRIRLDERGGPASDHGRRPRPAPDKGRIPDPSGGPTGRRLHRGDPKPVVYSRRVRSGGFRQRRSGSIYRTALIRPALPPDAPLRFQKKTRFPSRRAQVPLLSYRKNCDKSKSIPGASEEQKGESDGTAEIPSDRRHNDAQFCYRGAGRETVECPRRRYAAAELYTARRANRLIFTRT